VALAWCAVGIENPVHLLFIVAVTAVAFVLWYSSVGRLGASRAGLLTGVAPVAAAATGVLLGGPAPRPLVWAGIAVVAALLAYEHSLVKADDLSTLDAAFFAMNGYISISFLLFWGAAVALWRV